MSYHGSVVSHKLVFTFKTMFHHTNFENDLIVVNDTKKQTAQNLDALGNSIYFDEYPHAMDVMFFL